MKRVCSHIKKYRILYLMLLPGIVWYFLFCYLPMSGVVLAFKNYRYDMGMFRSPWCGLDNFVMMFHDKYFLQAFQNTIIISLGKILLQFPSSILLALMLNEVKNKRMKKFFQTVFTFPHFISWVVLASIFMNLFSSTGIINQILNYFELPMFSPLITTSQYRGFLWASGIWKEVGWDTIIFLAAITNIDPSLYEAAEIDGASRAQRIWHITLPGIRGIICIMLILQVGNIMGGASFNQIFNTYSSPVHGVGDIIDTFVQRYTFVMGANFGYTTAVGLFKSVIGVVMITIANKIVTKSGETGLF